MTNAIAQNQPATTPTRRDIHQQVTDTIIKQLEAGTVPWEPRWNGGEGPILDLPYNLFSNKKYRGINILLLWSSAIDQRFSSCEWGSFKQWQEKKEQIRKGEKGTMIVYTDTFKKEVDGELKDIRFLKSSFVFNRCQLMSYEPRPLVEDMKKLPEFEKIQGADNFVRNTGAMIEHGNFGACYSPSRDIILMPQPESFRNTATSTVAENYYSTLAHELVHWTKAPHRLNREQSKKYGDEIYANEELIAELGAAFICNDLQITREPKADHATYIESWLKVLKDDKHSIISAASKASKAVEYLKGFRSEV